MKNFTHYANFALVLIIVALFASCGGKEGQQVEKNKANKSNVSSGSMGNICYVDGDSVAANYNLSKDLNEAMLRNSSNYEAVQRQKGAEIQKFNGMMQSKYQNNGYLTEASFKADQQKLQKMQMDAENYLGNLQRTYTNEARQSAIQLQDSIDNFMKIFAKQKGYDMIIQKTATFYIDPKFDETDEVIKGLNARYVKVKK